MVHQFPLPRSGVPPLRFWVFPAVSPQPLQPPGRLSLSHYLVCPILWKCVAQIIKIEIPVSPAAKLCLTGSFRDPRALALAHCMYHGLRLGNYELTWNSATRAEIEHVIDTAIRIGQVAALDMH